MTKYAPQICIMWAQADLGNRVIAFNGQMSKDPDDNKRLLDISRKIKEKAAEIEGECSRRIECALQVTAANRTPERRRVTRSGIRFGGKWYYHPALARYVNDAVTVKQHGEDLLVYHGSSTPICAALESIFEEMPEKKQKCLSCPCCRQADDASLCLEYVL